ncbi:glycerate kinase [Terrihalobacillus insolitus]|uniref:glycerate kinase n=1 Tax=Terrihalobacillus insolitus TaxID=2950438 RepID=UPI00234260A3|nr:glycerate kinase [Terrihalobacillus insolitus]MDC3414381.1 glycerate kinase [Terrihalobacillus insolitus]
MNIVISPDSFKGSLTSTKAAVTIERAIQEIDSGYQTVIKPMADGGEGTLDAFISSSNSKRISLTCTGPLGEKIDTNYAITEQGVAIIELASIAGLPQVPSTKRNPDLTTSFGLGEAMLDAMERDCTSIVIGLGGSATNDGGLGMLLALGMKAWDKKGKEVGPFGRDLLLIENISCEDVDPRLATVNIRVACDVDNPLCGLRGASSVYGPQKGATKKQVQVYDQAMGKYAGKIEQLLGLQLQEVAGAGAAGGLGFAMLSIGASLESGAKLLAESILLEETIKEADLVITGEGQSDEQTLYGKAPGYVAELAKKYHVPAILISGSLSGDLDALRTKFAGCFSIINRPLTIEECMEKAEELLFEQTKQVIHFARSLK